MKGYRTIIFNVIMAGLAALRILSPESILPSDVDVNAALTAVDEAIAAVLVIGNLILRAFTDSKIGKKE
jgi:hypothetical protein